MKRIRRRESTHLRKPFRRYDRKFLTSRQMSEAKRVEAVMNAVQKRNGTNFPVMGHVAWSCGCCVSVRIKDWGEPILSPAEADEVLRQRKRQDKVDVAKWQTR